MATSVTPSKAKESGGHQLNNSAWSMGLSSSQLPPHCHQHLSTLMSLGNKANCLWPSWAAENIKAAKRQFLPHIYFLDLTSSLLIEYNSHLNLQLPERLRIVAFNVLGTVIQQGMKDGCQMFNHYIYHIAK